MKKIFTMDQYFESLKFHMYFFDILIKKSSITKESLLKDLDIAYMTYNRAKESDSNAGYKLVSRLEQHFNITPLNISKKKEYEKTLNILINKFYYRNNNLYEIENLLIEYMEENNYLKPLFTLMLLLVRLVKVKDPKSVLEENKDIFKELKLYSKKYFISPFSEMFTIVEILYSGNKLYEMDFSKNISENMKGLLYNSCAVNAFVSGNYSLCLYYCGECRNYFIKEHNYNRLVFINLMYFACLNSIGEYTKCFNEARLQLIYLSESNGSKELINATRIHYYTSCLGLGDYEEVINSISECTNYTSNDYIFILLAAHAYDKKLYQKIINKYSNEKMNYTLKQNEYINLIIDYLTFENKMINRDKIIKSELNIGLKEILNKKNYFI